MVQTEMLVELRGFGFAVEVDKSLPALRVLDRKGGVQFQVYDLLLKAQCTNSRARLTRPHPTDTDGPDLRALADPFVVSSLAPLVLLVPSEHLAFLDCLSLLVFV